MPEFPTADSIADLLGPQFDIYYWQGLFAPSETPEAVIKTLNAALQERCPIRRSSKIGRHRLIGVSERAALAGGGAAFLKSEIARWGQVIRDNDIQVTQ